METAKTKFLSGTLDLMVFKLWIRLVLHGLGMPNALTSSSGHILQLSQRTIYFALLTLDHTSWVSRGLSKSNRESAN